MFHQLSSALVIALAALASASTFNGLEGLKGKTIPGKYVVSFKSSMTSDSFKKVTSTMESDADVSVESIYNINNNFRGLVAEMTPSALDNLKSHPDVEFIEEDKIMTIFEVQRNLKNWGLGRITHRRPKSHKKFIYPEEAGKDVDIYVVDTGCKPNHPEFEGRARIGASFVGEDGIDGNGHGTHVAGTIAGKSVGVAKKANIICVQVLTAKGSGSVSGVVSGINYVAEEAKKSGRKSVANMSLGGEKSDIINKAVNSAIENGVTFVVAAGNDDDDACEVSPASTPNAITVAATNNKDSRASFSNWGKCVDVFAPGEDIYSSWHDGTFKSISGTSMAAPHAAGVAALYLSQGLKTPAEVAHKMVKKGTKSVIQDVKDSPNVMIYSQAMMPRKPKSAMTTQELDEDFEAEE